MISHTLLETLDAAHAASARRENVSTAFVAGVARAGGSYANAIAAALMSLGGLHGPLQATQDLLEHDEPVEEARSMLDAGKRVPGWGSSFVRHDHDPLWNPVRDELERQSPEMARRILTVTALLHERGKIIYPNPSAYTAACAILMGLPAAACASLFVRARLTAWTKIYLVNLPEEAVSWA